MKNSLSLSILVVLLLAACNRPQSARNSLLSTAELESADFTIDITKDNTITGNYGAIITIPAGAIVSDTNMVTVELIETYSINDMIKAGLTTQSNGLPLSSEGMIYIGTGVSAEITRPISVYMPIQNQRKGMLVYTGFADYEGNMNWRSPAQISFYNAPTGNDSLALTKGVVFAGSLHAPAKGTTDYYHFITETAGWFNVANVTKGLSGFEQSNLLATITNPSDKQLFMYLVIPSKKMFLIGGPARGEQNSYAFFTDDAKILLPHNTPAYILAMGGRDTSIVLGLAEFTTAQSKNVDLTLQPITNERLASVIQTLK